MRLAPGLCLHPREAHEVIRHWPVRPGDADYQIGRRAENALAGFGIQADAIEQVRCRLCGHEWQRLQSAQGEDV